MDYCIYKTINGGAPHVIHTFTQAATNSRAKVTAKEKLHEMFSRVACRPNQYRNLHAESNEDFSYEFQNTAEQTLKARFYIAQKV